MSQSRFYVLHAKSARPIAAFNNGFGSAPVLWDYLAEKYLGWSGFRAGPEQDLWDLARDSRLTHQEKVCHMLTFDRAYVPLKNLDDASDACLTVYADMPARYKSTRENHWQRFGTSLGLFPHTVNFHRLARGVCLSPTTTNDGWLNPRLKWAENAWPIYKETQP